MPISSGFPRYDSLSHQSFSRRPTSYLIRLLIVSPIAFIGYGYGLLDWRQDRLTGVYARDHQVAIGSNSNRGDDGLRNVHVRSPSLPAQHPNRVLNLDH